MILYFADRKMKILGQASSSLPKGFIVSDDLKSEEIETGVAVFSCNVSYKNEDQIKLKEMCKTGNYILRCNGDEQEFYTIIDSEKDTKAQEFYIYAEDAGLDLINEVVSEYEATEPHTADWYISQLAADAGFEIGINEIPAARTKILKFESESTATKRIAEIAEAFGGFEVSYTFKIEGLAVTHKYINIYENRGKDMGIPLRLNKELDRIVAKETISNLATELVCEGGTPDDAEDPITLEGYSYDDGDFYTDGKSIKSRNALAKWERLNGGHIAKPFSCEALTQTELCTESIAALRKICDTEINLEVDINRLPDNVKIGDRVNVIDDAGELYFSTRILLLENSVTRKQHKATLGEHLIKTDGISQKVKDLAAQFAKQTLSVKRAQQIANNAVDIAEKAQTQAETAAAEAENALTVSEEAKTAAGTATQSAATAQAKAEAAEAAVNKVENSVTSLETTVNNAQAAAQNAQQAATTAQTKSEEAKTAAANAQKEATEAKEAAGTAQSSAESAVTKADTAINTANTAKSTAEAASTTAQAAKLDAEQAEKDIATFAENLETLENTMSADYARKTDLTEATASLQTQITQNANEISSTASMVQRIDETANNAAEQAQAAQTAATAAQSQADQATADAQAAQTAADNAATAAQNAQTEADNAKAAAAAAQSVADKAETDLEAAKADLQSVTSRVDATEEEIEAAQAAVNTAQAAADKAKADASAAAEKATTAQNTANTAVTNASNAQQAANNAAEQAAIAKQTAEQAQGNAETAQARADEAAELAEAAQATANTAKTNAATAQAKADQAATDAATAQATADAAEAKAAQAETDLETAKQNLADVTSRVGATEEEVAAAQEAVETAQAAADQAKADAEAAQSTADTAKANAATAQQAANNAKTAADNAQEAAADAQAAADKAQGDVNALTTRVTTAETNISQNSEEIALRATKTEVETAILANSDEIRETISESNTTITASCEGIILEALKSYTETGDFEAFKSTTESQLALLSNQLEIKFTETIDQVEASNGDLQAQLNTITKYFTFDINGLVIGSVNEDGTPSPNRVLIDNDEIKILVNEIPVQVFDAAGNAQMPSLNVTQKFNLLGYLIEKDDNFNVNCDYIGVPFYIIQQPTGGSITAGVANTSVVVSGEIMSYQWQYDLTGTGVFQDLPENPTPTQYTASKTATLIPPGPYTYRCKITDVSGNVIYSDAVKVDA